MTLDLRGYQPRHPTLYQLAADGQSLDFVFARCPACGHLAFPADAPGCSQCGDPMTDAERITRPGTGTLLEFVTLHVPLLPGMEVPRVAADIRLGEDGPIEEGVMATTDESQLRVGMPLRAVAHPLPSGEFFDCRFVPATEAQR